LALPRYSRPDRALRPLTLVICARGGPRVARAGTGTPGPLAEGCRGGDSLRGRSSGATEDATSIRVREGELQLTDGPFAEAKEQMAGFDPIDCADLDEAIEVVSKHPVARLGTIELRPLTEDCR
jgi:YCII-related domain